MKRGARNTATGDRDSGTAPALRSSSHHRRLRAGTSEHPPPLASTVSVRERVPPAPASAASTRFLQQHILPHRHHFPKPLPQISAARVSRSAASRFSSLQAPSTLTLAPKHPWERVRVRCSRPGCARACFRARALDERGEAHLSALRGSARAPEGAIARRRLEDFLALLPPKPDVASEDPLRCAG